MLDILISLIWSSLAATFMTFGRPPRGITDPYYAIPRPNTSHHAFIHTCHQYPSMVSIPSHQPSPTSPININPPSQPKLPPNQQPHHRRNIHHPLPNLHPPPRPPSTNRIKRTPPPGCRVRIPRRLRPSPPTNRRRRPLHRPLRLHKRRRRLRHRRRRRRR